MLNIDQFKQNRAMVIGDLMIDEYLLGTASRQELIKALQN